MIAITIHRPNCPAYPLGRPVADQVAADKVIAEWKRTVPASVSGPALIECLSVPAQVLDRDTIIRTGKVESGTGLYAGWMCCVDTSWNNRGSSCFFIGEHTVLTGGGPSSLMSVRLHAESVVEWF